MEAEAFGGLKILKANSALYTAVELITTRGINGSNVIAYLENPKVVASDDSWIMKCAFIVDCRIDKITSLACKAVNLVQNMKSAIW